MQDHIRTHEEYLFSYFLVIRTIFGKSRSDLFYFDAALRLMCQTLIDHGSFSKQRIPIPQTQKGCEGQYFSINLENERQLCQSKVGYVARYNKSDDWR